ncbi:MAG TPA: 2-amino-4-hydroxy-6-hydroxymethyldihydropteridine diphosphokinase [Blastocatellia bacterium]
MACYLGLGSNLGDRAANLARALGRLSREGMNVVKASSVYETEPVDYLDQPWFLNQVAEIQPGSREPREILRSLLKIEREMGRQRTITAGPRVIDIDLLLCGNQVMVAGEGGDLVLPHPRLHLRRFVLEPLCELAPDLVHPVFGKTCSELLQRVRDGASVRRHTPHSG